MTTEAAPLVWVSFDLVGHERDGADFDPAEVTNELGIAPTQQNRIGDSISARGGRRSFARWRVSMGPVETVDISSLLLELVERLEPATPRFGALCQRLGIEPKLTCTVEPKSAVAPDITFPDDVIQWAATNHVTLGVDLMLWRDSSQDYPLTQAKPD